MSYKKRSLEELNVMDDFLFNAITGDPEVGIPFCRAVLSVFLQRSIKNLRIVTQRTIPALLPGLRGIRMDLEITEFEEEYEDGGPVLNIYDLEPHLKKEINIARHNRFYQARIDSRYLNSGEDDFSKLPNLYVLTITNFDPFGHDYMMYTVENKCLELPDMRYDDGVQFVYFYTGGSKGGSPEIQAMLKYFQESIEENVTNEAVQEIHNYVSRVKVLPEVKQGYMTFEQFLYYEKKEAAKEAVLEERIHAVLDFLQDLGPVPDALKEYLQKEAGPEELRQWSKLAARASSIQEFQAQIHFRDEND